MSPTRDEYTHRKDEDEDEDEDEEQHSKDEYTKM